MVDMDGKTFVKNLQKANSALQGGNKFPLVDFPTEHFHNANDLEKAARLLPRQLKAKFNYEELSFQELMLVLRYKLSKYVGIIPCILANKQSTIKFLKIFVVRFFSSIPRVDPQDILKYYNDVTSAINSDISIKYNSSLNSKDDTIEIYLPKEFEQFKSIITDTINRWSELKKIIGSDCEKARVKWLNDTLSHIQPPLNMTDDNIKAEVNRIYANCVRNDATTFAINHINSAITTLSSALTEKNNKFEATFNSLKLFDNNKVVKESSIPNNIDEMCPLIYFSVLNDIEEKIQRVVENANGGLYITKETQTEIQKKLEQYAQNPSEDVPKDLSDETVDKSEPTVGTKKRLSRRLSLSLKSAGGNIARKLRRNSAPPGSLKNFEWQKSNLKKENVDRRKRQSFLSLAMKHHVSRLLKVGSSLSQKQLNDEVDKLAKNYSDDNKEQEYYKEKFTDLFMLNCFALDNKDELKEFFKLMKSAKKNPQALSRLSPDTLDFYNYVANSEGYRQFVTLAFGKFYKINGERTKPLSVEFKVSLLPDYCFDMKTSLLPEKGAKNSEKITISLGGKVPAIREEEILKHKNTPLKDEIVKITIPENYEDLVQELMVKVKKRYDRSDSVLLPRLNHMLEQLGRVLPEEVYVKNYPSDFIAEIKGSIFLNDTGRKHMYDSLKEMNGSDNYKKAFQEIKNEKDKNFIISEERGDKSSLLKLIWIVFVDFNIEGKYNALMKKMESDLSRAKGKAMIEERKRRGEKAREETQRKGISIGQRRKTPSPNGNSNATSQNKPPPEHLPPEVLEATKPSSKDSNTTSQNKPRSNVERLKRFFEGQSRSR